MNHNDDRVLQVSDLRVTLEDEDVLTDLSFIVRRGEVLTILGPNGAGKTVLLRALLGAVPYYGVVSWKEGSRIGYVPQRLPYIKSIPLSVAEFFALRQNGGADVGKMLEAVGLDAESATKSIGDFSSGQFQRIPDRLGARQRSRCPSFRRADGRYRYRRRRDGLRTPLAASARAESNHVARHTRSGGGPQAFVDGALPEPTSRLHGAASRDVDTREPSAAVRDRSDALRT